MQKKFCVSLCEVSEEMSELREWMQSEVVYMTTMTSETLLESLLPADLPLSMSDTSFSSDETFENFALVKDTNFVQIRMLHH